MIINKIIKKIWQKDTVHYNKLYLHAMSLSENQLYKKLLKKIKMGFIEYPTVNMNLLQTTGCSNHVQGHVLSGCSICDYHTAGNHDNEIYLRALRKKNKLLYAELLGFSFFKKRKIIEKRTLHELISGYDICSEEEFPEDVFKEIFIKKGIYKRKPLTFDFEARADKVTEKRIEMIRKYIGKSNCIIQLGIEVKNEWVRNHWINKNITNTQILKALKIMQNAGIKAAGDCVFGVPGFSEHHSIETFLETIRWLHESGFDRYYILPLNRKKKTLQGLLYSFRHNGRLSAYGIVDGPHTGLPWMFSFLTAITRIDKIVPDFSKKYGLAQYHQSFIKQKHHFFYNYSRKCSCFNEILLRLKEMAEKRRIDTIREYTKKIPEDACYKKYTSLLHKQNKIDRLGDNMHIIIEEITKKLWPDSYKQKITQFSKELLAYE